MAGRLFVMLRAAFFASLFIALWIWFVPRWLGGDPRHPQWSALPILVMLLGALVMLRCVWDFAWTGRGTPAPWDAPRHLVIRGLYRYVRNPMYVGMGLFLVGEAFVLPPITWRMLVVVLSAFAVVTLFILFYEEPTLRGLFGSEYEEYCRNVRRWIPRLTPFDKPRNAAVPSPHLE